MNYYKTIKRSFFWGGGGGGGGGMKNENEIKDESEANYFYVQGAL